MLPLLKSLSIEEESTGPGRYIGKFTVRFLPDKIYNLFAQYGVMSLPTGHPMLVIPLWKAAEGRCSGRTIPGAQPGSISAPSSPGADHRAAWDLEDANA